MSSAGPQQVLPTTVAALIANKGSPCIYNGSLNVVASSEFDANHGPQHCVLNSVNPRPTIGASAWCVGANDANQYIVASCDTPRMFTGIATQGRANEYNQWVTSYTIRYTQDNVTWYNLIGGAKIAGNSDANTVVAYSFEPPIYATSIALHPVTFNTHMSLRWELYHLPLNTFPSTQIGSVSIGNRDLNAVVPGTASPRTATRQVTFPKAFLSAPTVALCLRHLDANSPSSPCYTTRIQCTASNITTTGFTCTFTTWADSNVYDATCDFVAEDGIKMQTVLPQNTVSTAFP
ncbi:hypothetical protein SAMD00019534_086130 [Acytostelium subglobosum LB1]|uniref:hypothetical protein n=1 Tax=Acytostelium subglobosum LB1 TaxID=1410327 RepID=UPI000644C3B5|nr:hypothetical protein SAMD00019534_086130 [Acytostelium subglobosum LB1]GAM25438.1 hypothetical protein SAMD00019534_086130 [Acytostelium subglobosum LB1]|eukprot:XP_012751424.1 hypothetical protein SAMD00019534_086130 [Acytostelium subglobosum LB1]